MSGPDAVPAAPADRLSLGTGAARTLSDTTKTAPRTPSITPRWLLRMLPWVQVGAGSYRVNRRLTYALGDGRITVTNTGDRVGVVAPELRELPALRDLDDPGVLAALAERFDQHEFLPGQTITTAGRPAQQVMLLAHGKVETRVPGPYGREIAVDTLADGEFLGDQVLTHPDPRWPVTTVALTPCIVLTLPRTAVDQLAQRSAALDGHLTRVRARPAPAANRHGEAAMRLSAGHTGEATLPGTFADYDLNPREYELSVAQTVLRIHTRVADLYNQPMDQLDEQLRLTVELVRERQEQELVTNRSFGLLHQADLRQRIQTTAGPPGPDDLDGLLSRRRRSEFFLAHPRTIAAFGRECNRLGVYPDSTQVHGSTAMTWRGVPLLPCDKIPVTPRRTSSILVLRTGEEHQGVVGLHRTGLPDEYEPGLSVRFTGIDERAIASYLVSAYYSAAVLVPDALGVLENVEVGR